MLVRVGTGFKLRETIKLRQDLDILKTSKPPVSFKRKGVVWVQPTLIAEIEYLAWRRRATSYKGLRDIEGQRGGLSDLGSDQHHQLLA